MLMGFDNKYPYTDFHELNLDWILALVTALRNEMKVFVNVNTIKYADPLQWNITTQYEQNTIVQDAMGATYLSKTAVPAGVSISNTDYWIKVASFDATATLIKEAISLSDDGSSSTTTADRDENDLVWLNDILYLVLRPMNTGDAYVDSGINPNIRQVSIEELIDDIRDAVAGIYGSISANNDHDSTTSSANRAIGDFVWLNDTLYKVTAAINAGDTYVIGTNIDPVTIEDELHDLRTDLDQEVSDRVADILAVNTRIDNLQLGGGAYINIVDIYNAVGDGVTDNTQIIQDAIDDVATNGGGKLYFPAGTYLITDTIKIKSNVALIGDGNMSVIKASGLQDLPGYNAKYAILAEGTPSTIIHTSSSPTVYGEIYVTLDDVSDLDIGDLIEIYSDDQNYNYQTVGDGPVYAELAVIEDISGTTLRLDHAHYVGITTPKIRKITACENISISNLNIMGDNIANNGEHGVYFAFARNAEIIGCHVFGFDWYSIGVVSSYNVHVTGNTIKGVYYDGVTGTTFYGIAVMNDSAHVVVNANIATRCRHLYVNSGYTTLFKGAPAAVDVVGNLAYSMEIGSGASYAYEHHGTGNYINITGNVAIGCYSGANIEGSNINISDNYFVQNQIAGVIIGDCYSVTNVHVNNNVIHEPDPNYFPGASTGGIYFTSVTLSGSNITITNNKIRYKTGQAIYMSSGSEWDYVIIKNNSMIRYGSNNIYACFLETTSPGRCVFSNNALYQTKYGIRTAGNWLINNNEFFGEASGDSAIVVSDSNKAIIISNYAEGFSYFLRALAAITIAIAAHNTSLCTTFIHSNVTVTTSSYNVG